MERSLRRISRRPISDNIEAGTYFNRSVVTQALLSTFFGDPHHESIAAEDFLSAIMNWYEKEERPKYNDPAYWYRLYIRVG